MACKTGDRVKWRRRRSPPADDDDCGSLAWLLNFRLDELVNVKVEEEGPRLRVPDGPPAPRKPPYTYPELIERALRERGELTVSAIYQWISDRFPYYKANDERWKNSVRHNLSINPHFRKGARASQGAGHLWSLAANALDLLPARGAPGPGPGPRYIDHKTEVYVQDATIIDCPKVIVLDEAAIAAANIIPDQDLFTGSTSMYSIEMFLNPVSSEQVVRECGLLVVD